MSRWPHPHPVDPYDDSHIQGLEGLKKSAPLWYHAKGAEKENKLREKTEKNIVAAVLFSVGVLLIILGLK